MEFDKLDPRVLQYMKNPELAMKDMAQLVTEIGNPNAVDREDCQREIDSRTREICAFGIAVAEIIKRGLVQGATDTDREECALALHNVIMTMMVLTYRDGVAHARAEAITNLLTNLPPDLMTEN